MKKNDRYGRFVIVSLKSLRKNYVICKCDCGIYKEVYKYSLLKGKSNSCGCFRNQLHKHTKFKHGFDTTDKIYSCWASIKRRCYNKNTREYHWYGARGIKMCDRWLNSFSNFLEDLGQPPTSRHTLDRIDNNGDYEPSNCRWATYKEQMANRRNSVLITYNGQTMSLTDWADKLGLKYRSLFWRYQRGWSVKDILTKPFVK